MCSQRGQTSPAAGSPVKADDAEPGRHLTGSVVTFIDLTIDVLEVSSLLRTTQGAGETAGGGASAFQPNSFPKTIHLPQEASLFIAA